MKKLITILGFVACATVAHAQYQSAMDPRKGGRTDDGTSAGALRVRLEKGDLVKIPLVYTRYNVAEKYGSASVTQYRGFVGGSTSPSYWNSDGSGSALQIDCPAVDNVGTNVNGGLHLWFIFSGPAIGWRWNTGFGTGSAPNTNDFGFMVDGISYEVSNYIVDQVTGGSSVSSSGLGILEDTEHNVLIADDLSKGQHRCDVYFPAATSGSKDWMIYGPILSRLAGYEEYTRLGTYNAGGLLTASAATVWSGNGRSIKKLFYCNQDASYGQTVTFIFGSNDAGYLYLTPKGTLGDSQYIDFVDGVAFEPSNSGAGTFAHKATTNAVVRWFGVMGQ